MWRARRLNLRGSSPHNQAPAKEPPQCHISTTSHHVTVSQLPSQSLWTEVNSWTTILRLSDCGLHDTLLKVLIRMYGLLNINQIHFSSGTPLFCHISEFVQSVMEPNQESSLVKEQVSDMNVPSIDLMAAWECDSATVFQTVERIMQCFQSADFQLKDEPIVKLADTNKVVTFRKYAIPGEAHPVDQVLKEAFEIFDYRLRMNHPRFFGFIPAAVSPLSWLGETFTTAFNAFAGSRLQSSGPSCIEQNLIDWLASKAGLPSTAGGLMVSGGSMANLTAMVLARDCKLPQNQRYKGVAYVSEQTHSSIAKGLRILGFEEEQIRKIPTDTIFRMDTSALKAAIKSDRDAGLSPFVVIASCGTTNTGTIDPLKEIVHIGRDEGLWIHVDGAYGASALLSTSRSALLDGIAGVDSISWDAHKWLFQTYGCGMLLVREKAHLLRSFSTDAEYIRDAAETDDIPNFWNFGIELTRPARAMKLWFTLRTLGLDVIGAAIDHGMELAECAQSAIQRLPNWEITSQASLAVVTFRFVPPHKSEDELDNLNSDISQRLVAEDIAGILTTKLKGKVVLRICSLSPLMTKIEMESVINQVNEIGENVLATSTTR